MDAAGVDRIVVGGDIAAGPMPGETIDAVLGLGDRAAALHGNADRELVDVFDTGEPDPALSEEWRDSIGWAGRSLTLRHDVEIFTEGTPDEHVAPMFADVRSDLVVCGHTHMQFERRIGEVDVVNAGSVGMPYGEPGAYWLTAEAAAIFERAARKAAG